MNSYPETRHAWCLLCLLRPSPFLGPPCFRLLVVCLCKYDFSGISRRTVARVLPSTAVASVLVSLPAEQQSFLQLKRRALAAGHGEYATKFTAVPVRSVFSGRPCPSASSVPSGGNIQRFDGSLGAFPARFGDHAFAEVSRPTLLAAA